MTNLLSIDYGRVHLGLALGEHMLATPLPPINNDDKVINQLKTITVQHDVNLIILGMPTGPLESEVEAFAAKLKVELQLPVVLHDETLTTQDAQKYLVASGANRRKRQNEHSYAAALILEDYLESAKLG